MAFSSTYIEAQLLRAQRAMLIISDRIQSKFLYLQSSICKDLQYKQRDIYILWNTLSDNYAYRATLSTYDALINVLIAKCQEVDSFNSTYSTLNPNYADIGGGTVIVPVPTYVTPVKLFFTNNAMPGIADWQGSYASTFGNDPTFAVYLPTGNPDEYALFTGVSEVLTFDGTGTLLQSAYFDFGVATTGYILIST